MDKIILGDNQFFGINHRSEEKALAQSVKFRNTKAIMDVIDTAYDLGIKTYMFTTHSRMAEICDSVRHNTQRYADFKIYPCLPYPYKYSNVLSEKGLVGALKHFASGDIIWALARGGWAFAQTDVIGIMKLLVDAEMKMFRGIKTEVIFLQNVMTDLLLGLEFEDVFSAFHSYVKCAYNAEAGFMTMNLPRLLSVLRQCGIENPIICSSFNKLGFRMSGGKMIYEQLIQEKTFRFIAMSIFASGAILPREAIEYVSSVKGIESIVFGASTRAHIKQSKDIIEQLCVG